MAGQSIQTTPCPRVGGLSALYYQDFLPSVDSPGIRDFHFTRQEEILALAQALQYCAKRSCVRLHRTSKGVWPLMQQDSDKIIEASLLGPTNDRPIMSPTLEEEAVLLGDELEPKRGSGGYHIFP